MKKRTSRRTANRGAVLDFNHAMIYTTDYPRAVEFYRDLLGFRIVDEYPGAYGRLVSPGGRTTIALHVLDEGQKLEPEREGLRLYFEVQALEPFCETLASKGVSFEQMPKDMPWGWRHAYLRDPDGHEISLYWAGDKRFKKTVMAGEPH